MGALVLLNGHLGYVHTKGFCSHKNGEAVPGRSRKWSVTYRKGPVLHFDVNMYSDRSGSE